MRDHVVDLGRGVLLGGGVAVGHHPGDELVVEDDVLLKGVARLVHIIYMYVRVVRVHLAAALVDGQEDGLDAGRGLRHEARGAGGGDGEAGNVASAELRHAFVECRIGFAQAGDEGVVLLAFGVVDLEGATVAGQLDGRGVGGQGECLLYLFGHVGSLFRTVTEVEGCQHVTLGGDAYAGASAHECLATDALPEFAFGTLDLVSLGVGIDLLEDLVDLLRLEVDDVVHDALSQSDVLLEQVEVEMGIGCEGVDNIGVEVDSQQSAAVIGTEGDLAAGVGGDGAEAEVGVGVGHGFAQDGVPEEHAWLG